MDEVKLVRGMRGYGWFPNVLFHDVSEPKKKYAIDFWLRPTATSWISSNPRAKGPAREGDGYTMITRLPVAWWWLPVSEHPGDTSRPPLAGMSAVHSEIASKRNEDGVYYLKDEKNGQTIPLEFIEIHQPIRRLKKDGRYFACTDFRKRGTTDEYYDVDFWLDDKDGKLRSAKCASTRCRSRRTAFGAEARYKFDGLETEEVK